MTDRPPSPPPPPPPPSPRDQVTITLSEAQAAALVTPQVIPTRVGPYQVVGKLGEGGMGLVLEAVQEELGRSVALKLLKPDLARDPEFVERFLREARSGALVQHPNVITIFDAGKDGDQLYMTCQLVRGGDLGEVLHDKGGTLTEHKAIRIMIDCCKGLQALHEAGLVHRDIKPGNIFTSSKGEVFIGDLGLARLSDGEDRMTMTGTAVGTPAYMSPEHVQGIADLDIRTDIYALGATLYRCLTGSEPFPGDTLYVITHKILTEPLTDPRRLNPSISAACASIIKKAMAKERAERYAEPCELQADLEAALAGRPLLGAFVEQIPGLQVVDDVSDLAPRAAAAPLASGRRAGAGTGGGLLGFWGAIPAGMRKILLIGLVLSAAGYGLSQVPDLLMSSGGVAGESERPAWASDVGTDQHGRFAILALPEAGELRLRWCPPGSYTIGSPAEEEGRHPGEGQVAVRLSRGFWLSETEITQQQMRQVLGSEAPPSRFRRDVEEPPTDPRHLPADSVSWDDAVLFCQRLAQAAPGFAARLPSEAEWEYACRAGSTGAFAEALVGSAGGIWATGELAAAYPAPGIEASDAELAEVDALIAAHLGDPGYRPLPVASEPPNRWGLFDMHGNLNEWCADCVSGADRRLDGPLVDPLGSQGDLRLLKGGSWCEPRDRCRAAMRFLEAPDSNHASFGFRVLVPGPVPATGEAGAG